MDLINCVKLLSLSAFWTDLVSRRRANYMGTGGRDVESDPCSLPPLVYASVPGWLSPRFDLLNEHFLASSGADDDGDGDV